jgi:hypothetical protein
VAGKRKAPLPLFKRELCVCISGTLFDHGKKALKFSEELYTHYTHQFSKAFVTKIVNF